MYKNEKLEEVLKEQGESYSPYLFKQHLPFMVLDRIYLGQHLNFPLSCQFDLEDVICYTIRAVRDIMRIPKAYQEQLRKIWIPGLEAFSSILDAFINEPITESEDIVVTVRKKLIQLGFDPLTMNYYNTNDNMEHPALRKLSQEIKLILVQTFMSSRKKNHRRKAVFKQARTIEIMNNLRSIDLGACIKVMRESVDISGRFLTLLYFLTFAKHYEIPDNIKRGMKEALDEKDFHTAVIYPLAEHIQAISKVPHTNLVESTRLFE